MLKVRLRFSTLGRATTYQFLIRTWSRGPQIVKDATLCHLTQYSFVINFELLNDVRTFLKEGLNFNEDEHYFISAAYIWLSIIIFSIVVSDVIILA